MKNSCKVSSKKLVYLTNSVTMFKFNLEKPGAAKTRKIAPEEFCFVKHRLIAKLAENECFWFILQTRYILSLLPNNSINCSMSILELTLLKLEVKSMLQ